MLSFCTSDRQTDKHTHTLIAMLHKSTGVEVIISKEFKYQLLLLNNSKNCFDTMQGICLNQRRRVFFVQFARWRTGGEVCRLRLHLIGTWTPFYTLASRHRWRHTISGSHGGTVAGFDRHGVRDTGSIRDRLLIRLSCSHAIYTLRCVVVSTPGSAPASSAWLLVL